MTARKGGVGVGVIGCGTLSYWTHLRILPRLAGVNVVAIADPSVAALARAGALVSARAYVDPGELLASSAVDAVVIAAPSSEHAALAIAACRAGKHVYVEKPLATSVAEARLVESAADEAAVEAVVGLHRRMHPAFQRARALLAEGVIGPVRAVHGVFAEPPSPEGLPAWKQRRETGGGVLLDLGVHHFDLLRWMLGRELRVVGCSLESRETEHDVALVRARAESDVDIQTLLTFGAGPADTLEFYGERGSLRVDRHRARIECRVARRFGYGTRRHWVRWAGRDLGWKARKLVRPSFEPAFERALGAFLRRIADPGGGRDDLAGIRDGVRAAEMVADAEAAARAA